MRTKVTELALSAPRAAKIIREIAKDTALVCFTDHAVKRMKERRITNFQVIKCLRKGSITEGPSRSVKGNWECVMSYYSAGQELKVVLALELESPKHYVIIITTF